MEDGYRLIIWTARLAMLGYALGLALRIEGANRAARWAWTTSLVIFGMHVLAAFQYQHHWSHTEAYASTAAQTLNDVGIDWGGGLYFNYIFTVIWTFDVIWWWIDREGYRGRPTWLAVSIQGFMAFLAFNATVVFASGASRWLGVSACVYFLARAVIWRSRGMPTS